MLPAFSTKGLTKIRCRISIPTILSGTTFTLLQLRLKPQRFQLNMKLIVSGSPIAANYIVFWIVQAPVE